MYGFWKNKRIVIFDTILCAKEREKIQKSRGEVVDAADSSKVDGMTNDEMLAVLGHELGHWALWNSLIIMGLFDINLLIMLSVFARFYHWELLYEAFGFSATPPLIGIILVYTFVLGPYLQLAKTFLMVITRQCEYAADRFSAKLGRTSEMISALKKLAKDNLDMPVDDPLHSMCTRSHPTTAERIRELRKMQ
ncbi:peptidase, M48 family [Necator americanus]|nr:peptidase, M48 family [Necator americanus]ETN70070.1 peptidase, M48 family [Necator americanus]